ncbi:hypothetical protein NUU61_007024 [Penicillium alfredii]|uniref:Uncharacterized protein n=1 Tax=Penicillium alfredii TaxID=1506179 RepID=A0A9W9F231_9EURO|nr:uncharacterized protein NUU61_007024 [Penicillium alfredii]KAJ5092154.1 hypothetical protein NUU61_007024 [Penicillium alfredii]
MSLSTPSLTLQASALSFLSLSIGHTLCVLIPLFVLQLSGKEWTANKAFKSISGSQPWACGTVGWYQGSAFFFVTGLLHYQWSQNSVAFQDPINKAIAGIINILLWTSSAWYAKYGVKQNAWAVGLSAALQAWGVINSL